MQSVAHALGRRLSGLRVPNFGFQVQGLHLLELFFPLSSCAKMPSHSLSGTPALSRRKSEKERKKEKKRERERERGMEGGRERARNKPKYKTQHRCQTSNNIVLLCVIVEWMSKARATLNTNFLTAKPLNLEPPWPQFFEL